GADAGTDPAARAKPESGPRPGNDLSEVPREEPATALRQRRGAGGGPGALAERRADSFAARVNLGAAAEMGETSAGQRCPPGGPGMLRCFRPRPGDLGLAAIGDRKAGRRG